MQQRTVTAYGKINLALDVIGKRPDGYHLLQMVMQQVELGDTLTLQRTAGASVFTMQPNIPGLSQEKNMAWQAFHTLQQRYHLPGGLQIELTKRLPVAAGLAGGSADGAAVLQGTVQLWQLPLSAAQLQTIGLEFGTDVPYCLQGGTMLAEGVGEQLTPLPAAPAAWVVLANPGFPVDTTEIFRFFDLKQKGPAPNIPGMCQALRQGDLDGIIACQNNVLERVTFQRYPAVQKLKEQMIGCGLPAMMSGSGGTVLALVATAAAGKEAVAFLQKQYPWVVLTKCRLPNN